MVQFKIYPQEPSGKISKPFVRFNLRGAIGTAWFDEVELRVVVKKGGYK